MERLRSSFRTSRTATRPLQLLTGERAVFEGEHAEEERQLGLLTQQVADAKLEVSTIAGQLSLAHQQLDSLSSYLTDLGKLAHSVWWNAVVSSICSKRKTASRRI